MFDVDSVIQKLLRPFLVLYAKYKIARFRWYGERRLRKAGAFVHFEAIPKTLVLTAISPGRLLTGSATLTDAVTGEKTVKTGEFRSADWEGATYFLFWGDRLTVHVSTDGGPPSPQQVAALNQLVNYEQSIRSTVESKLCDYYRERIQPHFPTTEAGEPLPEVISAADLGKVLYLPPDVWLEDDSEGILHFRLNFSNRWNYYATNCSVKDWDSISLG